MSLENSLMAFAEKLKFKSLKINTFAEDLKSMENGITNNKPYSRKTVEPMTRLRKPLERVEEDPNEQFIKDQLHDILGIE